MRARRNAIITPAFSLVEVLVAIGVLAIVVAVTASIFATVGDTVTQGRQVSNLNRFVSRVERVMRRDFEAMIRENGFMVIRNEITHDYSGASPSPISVGLTPTDTERRARRIDEIMFFARGDFTSRRAPLHPDMVARSDVARIYYGHGQRMPAGAAGYDRPFLDERNDSNPDARLGQPSALGVINPNEFASDWTLLRHATLLVPRPKSSQQLPDRVFGLNTNGPDYKRFADSSRQAALGPAAQSVFRSVAASQPYEIDTRDAAPNLVDQNPTGWGIRPGTEADVTPLPMSGIVDVAVTDLDEIRRTVVSPFIASGNIITMLTPRDIVTDSYRREELDYGHTQYDADGVKLIAPTIEGDSFGDIADPYSSVVLNSITHGQLQQQWMLDALPSIPYDSQDQSLTGHRMRYEPIPPLVYPGDAALDAEALLLQTLEQADQEMLASSVFVPRCTEFIVEWTLGAVDERGGATHGQQLWHGLRRTDPSGRLITDVFGEEYDGRPFADALAPESANDALFNLRAAMPTSVFEDGNEPENDRATGRNGFEREIIESIRVTPGYGQPASSIAEYAFGYSYEDWNGDEDGVLGAAGDGDDETRPWPWPKMVRVTVRYVDPADLEDEQTFQFEFRVPGIGGDS